MSLTALQERVALGVVNLPRRSRDMSWNEALVETGYRNCPDAVGEVLLERMLRLHPDLVDDWLGLSADQRCTPSWAFGNAAGSQSGWSVRFIPGGKQRVFTDRFEACAFFVKRMIDGDRPA